MNNMKTSLVLIGVIIIAAIGYFVFMMQPTIPATDENPTGQSDQAKIDINAVCEGALAYMSFPSSVEAEAWVVACKNGEHPEAIEQWKQMNGITDDRAI